MSKELLYLNNKDFTELMTILAKYQQAKFYAYGSRVKGNHQKFSDLDLLIEGEADLGRLEEELENSNLPIKVEVKKRENISNEFYAMIQPDLLLIKDINN